MNAQTPVVASLASAMAAAFSEIDAATKASPGQVGQQKYKYADLTAVIEAIKPALIKHNLFFTQRPQPSENGVTITTMLHHASGEEMCLGTLFVPANKNDAQGFGSALTYARRYALVTAFGVPVEDDDGNAASGPRQGEAGGHSRQDAVNPPPADTITDEQMAKLQMLIKATGTVPAALLLALKAPDGMTLRQMPQHVFPQAVEILEETLAGMAKAETAAKAKTDFREVLADDIRF